MKKVDLTLATPQQVKEIGAEINHLERMLEADKQRPNPKIQDIGEYNEEIKKKKTLLSNHAPVQFRGKNKDKAAKRIDELDSFIQDHMPKKKEYYMRYPKASRDNEENCDNNFERAVNQQIAFQTNPAIQKAITERKYLVGRLEPQDPTLRNIENLRK